MGNALPSRAVSSPPGSEMLAPLQNSDFGVGDWANSAWALLAQRQALCGPFWLSVNPSGVSLPLSIMYPELWRRYSNPTIPAPLLQEVSSIKISSWELVTSEIQSLDLLVCFRNDPQAPSYIFLLDNQRPRLTPNQRLRSFWLDFYLLLEVTLVKISKLKVYYCSNWFISPTYEIPSINIKINSTAVISQLHREKVHAQEPITSTQLFLDNCP